MSIEYPYLERYLMQFAPYSNLSLQTMAANGCVAFNELVRPSALEAVRQLLEVRGIPVPERETITAAKAMEMQATQELATQEGLTYTAAQQLAVQRGIVAGIEPSPWKALLAIGGIIGIGAVIYFSSK